MARSHRPAAALALFGWGYAGWLLLTWTVTAEQLVCGALVSATMTALLLPVTPHVARPWALLAPRRAVAAVRLILVSLTRIALANVRLAARIWAPSLPLRSGMIVVDGAPNGTAELAGIGLLSSLIVDSQLTDVDRGSRRLQYHTVEVPEPAADRSQVLGGTGPLVRGLLDPERAQRKRLS